MRTRTKIQRAMKQFPLLTDFGVGLPYGIKVRQRNKKIKEGKQRLFERENQFEAVCRWLEGIEKTEDINPYSSSYYLKHIAENRLGLGHISNGTLIAAAVHCGFKYKQGGNYPNLVFNMSASSIHEAYKESLLYQKYPNNQDLIHGGRMN